MNLETILLIALAVLTVAIVWGNYMQDTLPFIVKRKTFANELKAWGESKDADFLAYQELEAKLKEADSELHCLRRLPSDYAYPVAYWGSRKAFCTGHDGAIDCEELKDPFKSFTRYIEKFSLVEKLWNRELENHSTVKMSTGQYITFHDARIFIGDDIRLMDNDDGTPPGPPQWIWTEGGWVKEDE